MNLSEIRTEVINLIQDTSYSDDTIDGKINECLQYWNLQVPLPGLKAIGIIDTVVDVAYTSLTSNLTGGFGGWLSRVKNADGDQISIYPSLELLMDDGDMDEAGDVEAVTVEGPTLWYRKIPATAETLTMLYYKNSSSLTLDADEPSDYPDGLHRKLFVNGTGHMIFDEIEDGVDGDKTNTKNQFWIAFDDRNKRSGINELRAWVGKNRRHHLNSCWNY